MQLIEQQQQAIVAGFEVSDSNAVASEGVDKNVSGAPKNDAWLSDVQLHSFPRPLRVWD